MIFIQGKIIYKGTKIGDNLCRELLDLRELGFQRNGV